MKASNAGWSRLRRPILGAVLVALALAAGVLGRARSRSAAPRDRAPASPVLATVPGHDTAAETWRVVPPPVPPRRAPRAPSPSAFPAAEPDWNALSVEVADAPAGEAVSLAGPAELASGLSRSERERLIAAGDDRPVSPKHAGRGTVVIGRGTPRRGGDGTCY